MHINISSEQYANAVSQLLKNIRTNQDSLKELSRWGLEIDSEPLAVRICINLEDHVDTINVVFV